MISANPYLIVRAGSVYIAATLTLVLWLWRRPPRCVIDGALLACLWNLPVVLALHVVASRIGWWQFDARGGLLLGMPVDLYLSWVWLWGFVPAVGLTSLRLPLVFGLALAFDFLLMPAAAPVLRLGPAWLFGEIVGLLLGFLPGQILARWTANGVHLPRRAVMQVMSFTGLLLFVLPVVVIEGSGTAWLNPATRPMWQIAILAQVLAFPVLIGLTAVQEFVERGGGTPIPFDPPQRLVTTGIYSYVRNPMQLSAVVLLLMLGLILHNAWVSVAAVMAHFYSVGLAGWDEGEDLRHRFGNAWTAYRLSVWPWLPRWRPWHQAEHAVSQLFVSERCDMCREVGEWFARSGARGLSIVPAESHASGRLTRITYEPSDGARPAVGIEAIARALEHIHFGWALLGFLLRLPLFHQMFQLLADASGGEARRIFLGGSQTNQRS
jgi:protein-S-isoprenylcysteine O-methyltransferase Ste14